MKRSEFLKSAAVAIPAAAMYPADPEGEPLEVEAVDPFDPDELLRARARLALAETPLQILDRAILHDGRAIELQIHGIGPRIQWAREIGDLNGDTVYEVERIETFVLTGSEFWQNEVMAKARFNQIVDQFAKPVIHAFVNADRPFLGLADGVGGWPTPPKRETFVWRVSHADSLCIRRTITPSRPGRRDEGPKVDILQLPMLRQGKAQWDYPDWADAVDRMTATYELVAMNQYGPTTELLPGIVE